MTSLAVCVGGCITEGYYTTWDKKKQQTVYHMMVKEDKYGNKITEYPRIPELQMRLKKCAIECFPIFKKFYEENGYLPDIRYFIERKEGDGSLIFYEKIELD